jgi:hypothetical protein
LILLSQDQGGLVEEGADMAVVAVAAAAMMNNEEEEEEEAEVVVGLMILGVVVIIISVSRILTLLHSAGAHESTVMNITVALLNKREGHYKVV